MHYDHFAADESCNFPLTCSNEIETNAFKIGDKVFVALE